MVRRDLAPGRVFRLLDHALSSRVPARKRHVCVCDRSRWFLRINSRPLWPPHHPLKGAECEFLEYDSYVELNRVYRPPRPALSGAEYLGRMTREQCRGLAGAVEAADTLTEHQKRIIRANLTGA